MKTIIFLFLSITGYSQTINNTNVIVNKVIDNKFQESYKVTNIYNLSTTQIDITKVNKVTNYNIYETNKSYKKENIDLYKNVKSGFKKKEDDNY